MDARSQRARRARWLRTGVGRAVLGLGASVAVGAVSLVVVLTGAGGLTGVGAALAQTEPRPNFVEPGRPTEPAAPLQRIQVGGPGGAGAFGEAGAPRIQIVPVPGAGGAPGGAVAGPILPGDPAAAPVLAEQPPPAGKGTAVTFWLFALLAVGGAIATITRRNAVTAVMCLVATFIAIAGIYVLLLAHFMAAIQVLVYAGAIMVLFVFVVMILNKEEEEPWSVRGWFGKAVAGGALVYFLVRLVNLLWDVKNTMAERPWRIGELASFGSTKAVGKELFTGYLFPFEAISVALLIAIVGAVVLAHPDHPSSGEGEGEARAKEIS
jgi:NADH-quinone oxidoreductase subunit J